MRIEKTSGGTEYLIYTPPGYNGSTAYPLLVYLHGAQAIGPNISCLAGKGLPGAIKRNSFFKTIPMIIIAPHVKSGTSCNNSANNDYEWDPNMVNEVIQHVTNPANYNIDANRIFGSGISLGAKGIWDYALAFPDKLAALVPFSGNAPVNNICTLKGVAVWAFHGQADGLIPPTGGGDRKGSKTVVEALNNCAKPPYLPAYLTLFEAKGHNGWDQVYDRTSGYDIYEWLLSLRKNVSTNYTPMVNLGADKSFLIPKHPLRMHSFAYDPNGNITKYAWKKISGPAVSFSTSKPFLQMKPTIAGTYVFRLTVTDDEGNSNSDDIQINILSSTSAPEVVTLRLYDGKNKKDLGPINFNQVVNLNNYNAELLDVVATTKNLKPLSNSVRFELDNNRNFNTMNDKELRTTYPNYTIGRQNHKFFVPFVDQYTITATAYNDRLSMTPGISYQVSFSFAKPAPAMADMDNFNQSGEMDQYRLYPNPVSQGSFVFENKQLQEGEMLKLLSPMGIVLEEYQITADDQKHIAINTHGLEPGTYFLQVTHRNKVVTHKIIVQEE